jgi:ribose transport system substrate-binding protein
VSRWFFAFGTKAKLKKLNDRDMNKFRDQRRDIQITAKPARFHLVPRRLCFASLITVLLMLASCTGKSGDSDSKYYLISAQVRIPYWRAAGSGFLDAAKQLKLQAEFVGPETYDPKAQQLDFERIAQTKPGGILISVANAVLMKADIDDAVAAGIPVITMDADSPDSKRLLFIGTDNYHAGVMGGKVAAKQLHGKGNVVIFTIPAMANLDDRLRGYRDTFAAYPGIKITSIVDMGGSPRIAFNAAEQIITKKKDAVDGFICLEAAGGKEVAQALDQHHVEGKTVVAMDADDETLEWIKKGVIAATIAQKPYTMSYIGLTMLNNLHQHPPDVQQNWRTNSFAPVPNFVDTGATLVDRTSVDAFMAARKSAAGNRM